MTTWLAYLLSVSSSLEVIFGVLALISILAFVGTALAAGEFGDQPERQKRFLGWAFVAAGTAVACALLVALLPDADDIVRAARQIRELEKIEAKK